MGLTPHEERQIHEIEESLYESDPGFAERINRVLRPRRKFMVAGFCLLAVVAALAISRPENLAVTVSCTAVAAFLAGWCLGRVGGLDPRTTVRRARAVRRRFGRAALWPRRLLLRTVLRRGR